MTSSSFPWMDTALPASRWKARSRSGARWTDTTKQKPWRSSLTRSRKLQQRRPRKQVIVTQDMNGIRQAALELLEESLGADDLARQIENLSAEEDLMTY